MPRQRPNPRSLVRSRFRETASGAAGRTLPPQTCPRLQSTAPETAGSWSKADAQLLDESEKKRNLCGLRELTASRRKNQRRWEGGNHAIERPYKKQPPRHHGIAGGQLSDMRWHDPVPAVSKGSRRVRRDVHSESRAWGHVTMCRSISTSLACRPIQIIVVQGKKAGRAEKSRATLSQCEIAWSLQCDRGNCGQLTEVPRPVAG